MSCIAALVASTIRVTKTAVNPAMKSEMPAMHPAAAVAGVEVGAGEAGDIGEIAGHERQDARRQEAGEAGQDGDGDGTEQRSAGGVVERPGEEHQACSASSSRTIGSRSFWSTCIRITAAMRPARSMTRVAGIELGGTAKSCAIDAEGSKMLP